LTLRVYDLAKELKISSAALMKHLKDMSIDVKSHMKLIDDEVADKLRERFKQEIEHIKQLNEERRLIQSQLKERSKAQKKDETPPPVAEATPQQSTTPTPTTAPPTITHSPFPPSKTEETSTPKQPERQSNVVQNPFETKQPETTPERKTTPPEPPTQKPENNPQNIQVWQEKPHRTGNERPRYPQNRTDNSQYNNRPQNQNYNNRTDNRYPQTRSTDQAQKNQFPQNTYRPQNQERTDRPPRQGQTPTQGRPQGAYPPRTDRPQNPAYDRRPPRPMGNRPFTPQTPRTNTSGVPFPKAGIVKPTTPPPFDDKIFGKKKTNLDDLGDKSKHIQAKIQNNKRRKKPDEPPVEIDETVLQKNIKQTLTTQRRKKYKKEEKRSLIDEETNEIRISEFTSVAELAKILDVEPIEIITKFMQMGKMVSINQRLDKESLVLICAEYEINIDFSDEFGTDIIQAKIDDLETVDERPRPPVVTIMGHVDHGKTSILDMIRKTKVAAGESGGITQHIGAYQAVHKDQKITFIDTPGHEAFTAMRARGANITDIAVIVVAANDGVKPQTIEAIDHARIATGVTMVIAINKIDLPDANIDRTIASLLEQNVYLEGYGGQVPWVKCSALTGTGIDELMEVILIAAEMKELKARFNGPGKGVVIEAQKDTRMGSMATILLQEGCLHKGDSIVVGSCSGNVRKIVNDRSVELAEISPADIAVIYGLNNVPKAGDVLNVVDNERQARLIGGERQLIRQEREKFQGTTNLGNLFSKIKANEMTELRLIVKGDVDGSVEAVCDSLQKLSTEEVKISIIRKSVGGIIEADVSLAHASDAIIIGFNVRANNKAKKLADETGVEIKFYQIIFEAIDDIRKAMLGLLAPEYKEKVLGQALVKQIFKIKKIGTIAGSSVEQGVMQSKSKVRLYRNDKVIYNGEMETLKHYNDNVKEVSAGSECGIMIKDYQDIKEGDIIECYIMEEVERQLT